MTKLIFTILIFLFSNLVLAESGCRLEDTGIFACHVAWFIYGMILSPPTIIGILILNWILKKLRILVSKNSLRFLTFTPIIIVLFASYILHVLYSDLTIYSPDELGNWNYIRDFILKPLVPTVIVYLILFFTFRKIEKKKKLNNGN